MADETFALVPSELAVGDCVRLQSKKGVTLWGHVRKQFEFGCMLRPTTPNGTVDLIGPQVYCEDKEWCVLTINGEDLFEGAS